jgi:amidase/aspartyl-tRNA(Asn)/glutamyl-tRNA(Gln) amidotransferase subunit A
MTATDLWKLTASELLEAYAARRASPVEAMQAVLARVVSVNPTINALFHIVEEEALAQARASEQRWAKNAPLGALDGIPVSVKDSVAVAGMPNWRGSLAYRNTPWSHYDSPPAARLKEAGAIIFAKATMPDLGMLVSGVSTAHGVTRNPWNLAFNTGGSSSGGAAAVAARLGPLTVGSDIAGSVRLPASLCGLASIKPTQGRIPHLPASPIRSAGPLARTVKDAALLLSVLAGPDARDYGSLAPNAIAYHDNLTDSLAGLKLGLVLESGFGVVPEPAVRTAIEAAAACIGAAGAEIVFLPPLLDFDPTAALNRILAVRSRLELDTLPLKAREGVHPAILRFCAEAHRTTGMELGRDYDAMERLKSAAVALTAKVDFLLAPTAPMVNFPADAIAPDPDDPLRAAAFTAAFNQSGQPAAVVCCGFDSRGLPIGLQIVGSRFDDVGVLSVAHAYEARRGFAINWPDVGGAGAIASSRQQSQGAEYD